MKKIVLLILLTVSTVIYSQTNGITYQAIIYSPSGEVIPGVNNPNAPLANRNICLEFSIVDELSQIEYQETITTITDEFGMVNLVIGSGNQTGGYATSFANIFWSVDNKSLKVALNVNGQCVNFVEISNQKFETVPFAFAAKSAENVIGVVPIENGGTNATTVIGAKNNLGLENVDNTSDINKPISTATQAALELKENRANKSTTTTLGTSDVLFPTQNAVKTYVDGSVSTSNTANTAAIAAVQADVDANETAANTAIAAVQADVDSNETAANTAIALKEDAANKSTTTTLGTSDVLFPTQNAVKTYVDGSVSTSNTANTAAIAAVQADVDVNETAANTAIALKEDAANKSTTTTLGTSDVLFPTQNAVKTYVDGSVSTSNTANTAAIAAVQADVDANETAANTAIALKEDAANKSTTTTLGTSDVLFPTQNAVKTYVDGSVSTSNTANTAAIAAVQAEVDANETAANTAIALKEDAANKSTTTTLGTSDVLFPTQNAVKTYVDGSVSTSNTANTAAIAAVQADVDANETAANTAIALKEDAANKSTTTTLGTSDVLFPTQNAVKTYVDGSVSTSNTANTAAIAAVQADVDANETAANTAIAAVQADVDANETAANTAIAAVQADVDANETAANTAIALKEDAANKSTTTTLGTSDVLFPTQNAVKTYVDGSVSTSNTANTAAIAAVQADVDSNETAANTAIALKEDAANKSTTTTLGTSDVLFPTQNAVKTYVDGSVSTSNTANTAAIAAVQADVDANETAANTAIALKEDAANKSTTTTLGTSDVLFPTQNAVKTYVDGSVSTSNTANTAAIAAVQADVNANETAANTAIALKEDAANKSTTTTLGTSDVLFPTQNAVKTYVDGSVSTSNTANTAAIAAVQADVDANETTANTAIALKEDAANKSTTTTLGTSDVLFPTQNAVKTYVDGSVSTSNTANTAAIAAVQADVDANETAANTAIALKEDAANKSTTTTLGTSDVLFPTQNAVKTYVDGSVSTSNTANTAAIAAVQADVDANETAANTAIAAVQADVDANETAANTAIAAVQADVDANGTAANTAIAAVQADVDANETAANTAIALKEDAANKSTTTTLGTSDVLFPTQNAVKTYVDTNVSSSNTANTAAIAAVQADVDANETAANTAIAAVQADVDANETAASTAIAAVQADVDANETAANTAIAAVQADVDANETAANTAIALKEDAANKSTTTTLGTSDVLFPTQNAVKTYVDGSVSTSNTANTAAIAAVQADVDANETAANTAIALKEDAANKSTTTTLGTSDVLFPTQNAVKTYVDGSVSTSNTANTAAIAAVQADVDANETAANTAIALKEDAANKSTTTTLGTSDVLFPTQNAVKTYVDGSVSTSNTANTAAIAAVQADVDANETAANTAIAAVQADVDANGTAANTAIAAVQADVDANETAANTAIALKEDAANKSTTTTLGTSDVLFPTQNAVKTYVDTNVSSSNTANTAAIAAVQADVDANETAATNAITTLGNTVTANATTAANATALKEDTANKSTTTTLGTSDVLFPTQNAVKTYVDTNVSSSNTANTAAIAAVQADVDANETAANTAIAAVQADVDANETAANTAIALKEDAANKSTTTTLGTSDVLFPTQNAVKTYVDGSVSTSNTANTAAIAAVQADVDANETAASTAIAAVQADVDANETAANTAIAAVQADVDANETAANTAIALKEDAANKSTTTTLGTSDVLFPTQNAVKTYVDGSVSTSNTANTAAIAAVQADVDANETAANTTIAAVQADVDANETAASTAIAAVQADVDANETTANTAIALKEDAANKSTTTTLGTSDVLFPTQNAVKTYVDGSVSTSNTANTAAIAAVQADVDANETAANTAIAAVQADVDSNETAANTAIALKEDAANKSTTTTLGTSDVLFPTQNAVKTYVDGSVSTSNTANTAAIAAVQADVDANETAANTAIAAVQADVDANETAANTAIALKEDAANKSTTTTLGTSDVLFPTQNAVKTYVDGSVSTSNTANTAAIAAVQADVDANETAANTAIALKEDAANKSTTTTLGTSDVLFPTQNAVKTYVDGSVSTSNTANTAAIAAVQADVDANETAANTAIALKEDAANKSTTTTLGTSDVLFPTQNAVKTYVDGSVSTSNTANTAAIAAVQADVDANETAANTAIAAVQADVDANETTANTAIALKEDAANKSTTTTLGTSDVLFPTQNAVKTYVDGSVSTSNTANTAAIAAVQADVDANETAANTAIALKEDAANKSTTTTLGTSDVLFPTQNAVKTYVDGSVSTSNTANTAAIAAVQADVDANETAANTAIALKEDAANKSTTTTLGTSDVLFPTQNAVKTYVDGSVSTSNTANTAAIAAVQTDVDANETAANTAIALKEDAANKSTTTTLGTSDVLFPTQNAVKTYVDGSVSSSNTANTAAIAAVQADVDANETAANTAITAVQADVDANETAANTAIALKEDAANKSTTTTLGTSDVLFPTQNAVKTYVDGSVSTSNTANTAAIAAVQADVDANETAANTADAALQTAIDGKVADAINDSTTTVAPSQNAVFDALALKSPLASPTFTGTPAAPTATAGDNTTQVATTAFVTSAVSTANATNANLTGVVTSVGNATSIADAALAIAKTDGLQTALDSKAPLASPTFTGTVSGVTSAMVGLGNVDNTSDADKPVSTATQAALDLKSPLASPTFTGTPAAPTATAGDNTTQVATTAFVTSAVSTANATNANLTGVVTSVGNATSIADAALAIAKTDGLQTALDSKAPLASPTFTGTVSGVTSAMVGLGNVDNTSDADKTVSTAAQAALDLKAPIASPTFTGTPTLPTGTIGVTQTAGDNTTALATTAFVAQNFVDLTTDQSIAGNKTFTSELKGNGLITGFNLEGFRLQNDNGFLAGYSTNGNSRTGYLQFRDGFDVTLRAEQNNALNLGAANQNTLVIGADQNATLIGNLTASSFIKLGGISTQYLMADGSTSLGPGLSNVDNTSDADKPVSTAAQAALDLKAPIASPTFTGTPTLPTGTIGVTQTAGDNTTALATTAFVAQNFVDLTTDQSIAGNKTFTSELKGNGLITGFNLEGFRLQNDNGFLAGYSTNGNSRTGYLQFRDGFDVTLRAEQNNALNLGAANQNTLVIGADQNATLIGNLTASSFIKLGGISTQYLMADGSTSLGPGLSNVDNTSDADKPVSTAAQAALDLKAPIASPTFTGTPTLPTGTIGVTQTAGDNTTALATTAFVTAAMTTATPDATTTVKGMVQLAGDLTGTAASPEVAAGAITAAKLADDAVTSAKIVDATIAVADLANDAVETTKIKNANVTTDKLADASVTDAKIVTVSGSKVTGNISGNAATVTTNADLTGAITSSGNATSLGSFTSSSIATALSDETGTGSVVLSNSPTFTGTVSGIDKSMVGLVNVDNTTDLLKPISTATQTALDDKLTKPIYKVALGYLAGTGQPDRSIAIGSNAAQNSQAAEAVAIGFAAGHTNQGINAVALGSAAGDDSQAANSIVINARGSANPLNASTEGFFVAPVRNITSSDFVYYNSSTKEISYGGITAGMVGLANVNNTSDANKPVSTAAQVALDLKAPLASPTFTGTPSLPTGTIGVTQTAGDSSTAIATTAFVTSAVSTAITEVSDEITATAAQTTFTISHAKGTNRTIKMYINGIRISNTAYSDGSTTVTYNSANNGGYTIVAGDRIQFDFSY